MLESSAGVYTPTLEATDDDLTAKDLVQAIGQLTIQHFLDGGSKKVDNTTESLVAEVSNRLQHAYFPNDLILPLSQCTFEGSQSCRRARKTTTIVDICPYHSFDSFISAWGSRYDEIDSKSRNSGEGHGAILEDGRLVSSLQSVYFPPCRTDFLQSSTNILVPSPSSNF